MKPIYFFLIITFSVFISCSSTQSFNHFYNSHKNDSNVSSFQVPSYLRTMFKNVSPELNNLFKNVKDFRTISFSDCTPSMNSEITNEIDGIAYNLKDIVRKNRENGRTLIAVKEKKDVIKEILIHYSMDNNHKILFITGNFDPERIAQLANTNEFGELYEIE